MQDTYSFAPWELDACDTPFIVNEGDQRVAIIEVRDGSGSEFDEPWEKAIANAKLIVAAPLLKAALEELLEICRFKCGPHDEIILKSGTNEQAMLRAIAALDVADGKLQSKYA